MGNDIRKSNDRSCRAYQSPVLIQPFNSNQKCATFKDWDLEPGQPV